MNYIIHELYAYITFSIKHTNIGYIKLVVSQKNEKNCQCTYRMLFNHTKKPEDNNEIIFSMN